MLALTGGHVSPPRPVASVPNPTEAKMKSRIAIAAAGAVYTLPIKLHVARAVSTVEVSAAAVAVETTTAVQTTAVPTKTVQDLPVNGRNFTPLVAFAPGFAGYGGSGSINAPARPTSRSRVSTTTMAPTTLRRPTRATFEVFPA
jgi:hypothetical protein